MAVDKEVNFLEILDVLLSYKRTITFITLIGALFSVIYALSLNNIYTSRSVLTLTSDDGSSSIASMSSRFSGLASMAGINIGASGGPQQKINTARATITSKDFFQYLISNNADIIPNLLAVKKINSSGELVYKRSYNPDKKEWRRQQPSFLDAFDKYSSSLKVSYNEKTGFLEISMSHFSPVFAEAFLREVIFSVNEVLREDALEEAEAALEYLLEESKLSSSVEIRNSVAQLIEHQLKKKMLAQVSKDYSIKYLDSPFIPEKKSAPSRSVICIVITLSTFFITILGVIIWHYRFSEAK